MKYLLIILLCFGCTIERVVRVIDEKERSEYGFSCQTIDSYTKRCTNKEVVCYTLKEGYSGGLSCNFKDEK
jgi:hypothetical protein